uniref:Uncharacterized protein n=1 Tax=Hyaloperonospora arabidopsidis (strain Emoy2) TaxID=559515 RepID=M4BYJ2_HYAAE
MSCVILHQTDNGIYWVIHRVSGGGSCEVLGVYCGSLDPDGCPTRAITRVQSSSAISNSTRPTSGRRSGDRPPVSGHGGGDRQGLGTNLVDSVLRLLRHPTGTAEPLGAQSQGNNRRPSEIQTTTNTASTAASGSGQGTLVQPRRGRLYFFPAGDRTLLHPGFSATVYSI